MEARMVLEKRYLPPVNTRKLDPKVRRDVLATGEILGRGIDITMDERNLFRLPHSREKLISKEWHSSITNVANSHGLDYKHTKSG